MNLNVLVTERCNFQCKHCLFQCPNDVSLRVENLEKTIKGLLKYDLANVSFSGGECIMHPEFKRMVDIVVDNNLTYNFTSNGFLYAEYLPIVQNSLDKLKKVRFSLDGMEETHDYIRKKGSYKKVIEAVYFYKSLGIETSISFVANKKNIDEIEDVVKLCKKLNIDRLGFGAILPIHANKSLWLSMKERKKIYNDMKVFANQYKVEVQNTLSVYKDDALGFCPNLAMNTLTLTQRNEFVFCCNIPGHYSKIGDVDEDIETILIRKKELSLKIFVKRLEFIKSNKLKHEDNTCLFCYKYFGVH